MTTAALLFLWSRALLFLRGWPLLAGRAGGLEVDRLRAGPLLLRLLFRLRFFPVRPCSRRLRADGASRRRPASAEPFRPPASRRRRLDFDGQPVRAAPFTADAQRASACLLGSPAVSSDSFSRQSRQSVPQPVVPAQLRDDLLASAAAGCPTHPAGLSDPSRSSVIIPGGRLDVPDNVVPPIVRPASGSSRQNAASIVMRGASSRRRGRRSYCRPSASVSGSPASLESGLRPAADGEPSGPSFLSDVVLDTRLRPLQTPAQSNGSQPVVLSAEQIARRREISLGKRPVQPDATVESRIMEDLSGYTCIAWAERTVEIPDEITVMTPQNLIPGSSAPEICTSSALLYKYTVFVDKYEYLHGISSRYEYNSAPVVSTSHIVYPPQCYILAKELDMSLIHKYSSAVVVTVQPDCYFATLANFCGFLDRDLHIRVNTKLLRDNTYLVYVEQAYMYTSLYSLLSIHLESWISKQELQLLPWSPQYGSTDYTISRGIHLKIKGPPCNLNVPSVIEHILSPFALVIMHHIVIRDSNLKLGNTIVMNECSALCARYHQIPESLHIKLLPASSTTLAYTSSASEQYCPILEVSLLMSLLQGM